MSGSSGARLRRFVWAITLVYWAAAFIMTHLPSRHVPTIPASDKLEHFLGYGLLGGCLFLALRLSGVRSVGVKVLAMLLVYGMIDEWLQLLPFVGRDCEFGDWCADVAGAATAVVIASALWCWATHRPRDASGEQRVG